MVVAESPNVRQFDPSLEELPVHTHLDPELGGWRRTAVTPRPLVVAFEEASGTGN